MSRKSSRLALFCRVFCVLCACAAAWAAVLVVTGGFDVRLGSIRVRSNNPRNPALLSVVSALILWLLSRSHDGRTALEAEWTHWRHWFETTQAWRARWRPVFDYVVSPIAVAIVGIGLDISQWAVALPLWVDEERIALNVRDRPIVDLVGTLWFGQSAPLGWLALERSVMVGLGTGERVLRLMPLLFGIATVIAAIWVGRRWMGRVAAIVFVLLCWVGRQLAHYRFEFKHYTADVFFGLTIPALAAWAVEAESARARTRRALIWWAVAAIGQWFANGALLVTPACALFLLVSLWRRDGVRGALSFSAAWVLWLASFGLHYRLSLRYTHHNEYLRSYWAADVLPSSVGMVESLRWFVDRLQPLALDPGGTLLWASLWISALCGLVFARKRTLGLALVGVPPSAFVFAALVPLSQRQSIWIVPALYAGIALLIDWAIRSCKHTFVRRRWSLLILSLGVVFVGARLCVDIYHRGRSEVEARLHATHKHQLDDRAAIRWLLSQRQPGDVVMTTPLATAAVWWYGDIPVSDEGGSGTVLRDGSPVYEVDHTSDCGSPKLEETLRDRSRVLLYLGFDVDPVVDDVLLRDLSRISNLTTYREFAALGRAAVLDLRATPSGNLVQLRRPFSGERPTIRGCTSIKRARRW